MAHKLHSSVIAFAVYKPLSMKYPLHLLTKHDAYFAGANDLQMTVFAKQLYMHVGI